MDYNKTIESIFKGRDKEKHCKKLFDQISPKIYFACSRYLKDTEAQNDSFQETMIKIFENLSKYDPAKGDFEGWAYKIAVNNSISYIKKHQNDTYISSIDEGITEDEVDCSMNHFSYKELYELLNYLPEMQRAVFNLYFVEGYSHKEIGELLNINESTSRSNYFRARVNLMEFYKTIEQE